MAGEYEKLVREAIKASHLYSMKEEQLLEIFLVSKALIFNGHFELLSNLHTDAFLRFAQIAQYPWLMSRISQEMTEWIKNSNIGDVDIVLGTSRAGKWFAYDIARELNESVEMRCRAVFAKTGQSGYPQDLLEGFTINKKERVLIVNDLSTTGKSLKRMVDIAESYDADIAAVCVFASRASVQNAEDLIEIKKKQRFHAIVDLEMKSWSLSECPLCKKNMDYVRSVDLNSLTNSSSIQETLKPLRSLRVA